MALKEVFRSATEVAFNTFKDAVVPSEYVQIEDSGFSDKEEVRVPCRAIFTVWGQEDTSSKLYEQVQPTDVKILIPGVDLSSITFRNSNIIDTGLEQYTIIDSETDPYTALYTILGRK